MESTILLNERDKPGYQNVAILVMLHYLQYWTSISCFLSYETFLNNMNGPLCPLASAWIWKWRTLARIGERKRLKFGYLFPWLIPVCRFHSLALPLLKVLSRPRGLPLLPAWVIVLCDSPKPY